jgi:3-dehydroquinate dehydratase-1
MLKIGGVQLGALPRVVLGVDRECPPVADAAQAGVDILEVRVDLFDNVTPSEVVSEVKVLKRHEMPLIGTIRSRAEGGKANLNDAQRENLYKHITPLVHAIDIDLSASILKPVVAVARRNKNTVILSHHDFKKTPSDAALAEIVKKANALDADIIKVAVHANDEGDVSRLLAFTLAHRGKNLVTISLGSIGSISRLLFPLAGSVMTYTSVTPSDGQIPAGRLIEDLRLYYPRYNESVIARTKSLEFA